MTLAADLPDVAVGTPAPPNNEVPHQGPPFAEVAEEPLHRLCRDGISCRKRRAEAA